MYEQTTVRQAASDELTEDELDQIVAAGSNTVLAGEEGKK